MSWVYAGRDGGQFELYARMEERYGRGHERRDIDRKYTASSKCIGCCLYEEHPGFVTEKIMAKHRCLEQDCRHFLPKPKKIRGFA